ncbi:unnamed protein product [Protopolystoma xenopodis]|uniref:RGS domain-containing protein n=1 Tax=Protopolystoma xenopodis TaxID=117903 RepID=A0A3S5BBV7_9PLAT|nr:unnamed protein product [Protopolystoma xenopodis]
MALMQKDSYRRFLRSDICNKLRSQVDDKEQCCKNERPQCTFTPDASSQAFSGTYKVALSSERLGSDSHGCGY